VRPNDPNDKSIIPAENIPITWIWQKRPVTYRIDFVNDGAGTASTITIDDHMIPRYAADITGLSSVQRNVPNGLSSTQKIKESTASDLWLLRFILEGCDLKAIIESVHDSHGYLTFSVPFRTLLQVGDTVTNFAIVYFDGLAGVPTTIATSCISQDFDVQTAPVGDTTRFITRALIDTLVADYLWRDRSAIDSCRWQFGDGASITTPGSQDTVSHVYQQSDTFNVTLDVVFHDSVTICGIRSRVHSISKQIIIPPAQQSFIIDIDDVRRRVMVRLRRVQPRVTPVRIIGPDHRLLRQTIPGGGLQTTFDMRGLPPGAYTVVVGLNGEMGSRTFTLPN
jgi:hypothetical protein